MITAKIPLQNIYFLLCYAWNHLQETRYAQVRSEDCEKIWDLLAKVLIRSSQQLVKRGLHRSYVVRREPRVRPKGKVILAEEIRRPPCGLPKKMCEFDELDPDVLPNQIIHATFWLLQRHPNLDPKIRKELREVAPYWAVFGRPVVTQQTFRRVRIHRNMRHYRFVLNVCELIHQEYLPNEADGAARFRDFLRDEATMGALFEKFVRNFYNQEQSVYRVSASHVKWAINPLDSTEEGLRLLPTMKTDIVLESEHDRLIIDCKFYRKTFQSAHQTAKFHSEHLYQLFAYVKNQAVQPGWEGGRGMLLYPTVGKPVDERVSIHSHEFRVASINLEQDWRQICSDLLSLLGIVKSPPESKITI